MAGIGILVDDNGQVEYAYKLRIPSGSASGGVVDLSNPAGTFESFLDAFNKAKTNADSIINNYTSGSLTSQSIVEDLITIYTVTFSYSSGILISKTISKTSGGSVTLEYVYASGNLAQINQIGGD